MRITKKDNVIFEGVKYVAVEYFGKQQCKSCQFKNKMVCHLIPCMPDERKDFKAVIFLKRGNHETI